MTLPQTADYERTLELLALCLGRLHLDDPLRPERAALVGDRCVDCGHDWPSHQATGCTRCRCSEGDGGT
jgi:hypothetical protein